MAPNNASKDRVRQARISYLLLAGFYVALTGILAGWNLTSIPFQVENLAASIGRSFFREMVATRQWNALHGGVYIPVTEITQPNPYLTDPLRDVVTTEGRKLTKINPAYMTRMIAELLESQNDIQMHITSLKPINPGNEADEWEHLALESFTTGTAETASVEQIGETLYSRFMAPLTVEESCLPCHAEQGYTVGDIRGGISISLPWEPFSTIIASNRNQELLFHFLIAVTGVVIILLLSRRVVIGITELQSARDHISGLEGFLPMCMHCRKVRLMDDAPGDPSAWVPLDVFLKESIDTDVTHGICPDCRKEHYSST